MFSYCSSCKQDVEPAVDKETLADGQVVSTTKAICPECKLPAKLSSYMIKSLVDMKRFYSPPASSAAFEFTCKDCGKKKIAKLSQDNKQALCGACEKPLDISAYMISAMVVSKNM